MSALRRQMEADMVLRGLAYRTRQSYIDQRTALACTASAAAVSTPIHSPLTAPVRWPLAPQPPHSPSRHPLTLESASVIVISSPDESSRPRDDAYPLPQSINRQTPPRTSARTHRYNLQSTAL